MTDSPGQILCTVSSDRRLIIAGAAAISSHAARRAGLDREAQDEIGDAAIEVCKKAFPPNGASRNSATSLRLGISDLSDSVEVTLEAADVRVRPTRAPADTSLKRPLSEQVRCESGEGYFRMTIAKLYRPQNFKPAAPGDSRSRG